jgi:hypothetical protein
MKKRLEKEDKLITDIMKDFQMENPPEGFTERVMQTIELESNHSSLRTSPLISKTAWIVIIASLLTLIFFLLSGNYSPAATESGWLSKLISSGSIPSLSLNTSDLLSRFNLGSTTLFWIFTGIAGIFLLAILERILEISRTRQFLFL